MKYLDLPAVTSTDLPKVPGCAPLHGADPRLKGRRGYHPKLLLSYYHWYRSRREPERAEDLFLFGDSGGYSIMTLGAAVDPLDALRWQMRTCNVGVVLDVPPWDQSGRFTWASSLKATLRNIRQALPAYLEAREQGTAFRWWGVCHGGTLTQLREWYSAVRDVYPFDDEGEGWAFKPMPRITPASCARVLGFVKSRGIQRAHFLMIGGWKASATLLALGPQAGLRTLSFDSASAIHHGASRSLLRFRPDGLAWVHTDLHWPSERGPSNYEYLCTHCDCVSCELLREDLTHLEEPGDEYWKYRMIFHNQRTMSRTFARQAAAVVDDPAMLRTAVGNDVYYEALRALEGREALSVAEGTPTSLLDLI